MLQIFFSSPITFLAYTIALLVAITIHEFAHAWTADYLGDPTAKLQGRVSLNPLVHLDLVGTALLLLTGFGWGKPVMFDPFNLKNPKKDSAMIALAGPLSNIILSIILALIIRLLAITHQTIFLNISLLIFSPIIYLNIILAIFNLIPIYPLDGFNLVAGLIPDDKYEEWMELKRYGFIFLLLLILPLGRSSLLEMTIQPVINTLNSFLLPPL